MTVQHVQKYIQFASLIGHIRTYCILMQLYASLEPGLQSLHSIGAVQALYTKGSQIAGISREESLKGKQIGLIGDMPHRIPEFASSQKPQISDVLGLSLSPHVLQPIMWFGYSALKTISWTS